MNTNPTRLAIEAAQREMAGWRNDSGRGNAYHNAQGASFYPEAWEKDMGGKVYHDPGRPAQAVEISLPHILNIANALAGILTVNLFGATSNYTAANFGNNVNITVTYTADNPAVPFNYSDLLGSILGEPMQVGITRIQAVTQGQANAPLSLLRNVGVGKFEGSTMFPLTYPNQFIATITYLENAYKVDKFQKLSYLQNGTTDANIQIYFYQNANVNLDRAFSNQRVVSEYGRPQTGISQQLQVIAPPAVASAAARSGSLL